jgi:hypothetical protein
LGNAIAGAEEHINLLAERYSLTLVSRPLPAKAARRSDQNFHFKIARARKHPLMWVNAPRSDATVTII